MTPRQKQLYDYLSHYLATNQGVAPSFDQMKEALGLASKSRIRILLNALEEQGLIWTTPNRARRIEIVRRPIVSEARPPPPVIVKSSVNLGAMASHIVAQPWCSADVETVLNSLRELKQGVAA